MESRDATFFENEFLMKNTPSETSHKTIIPHEQELSIPIDHAKDFHMHIPEEDDAIVTRKSKRQRFVKSFGDDFIVYLVEDTPTTIREHIPLLMLTYGRKQ
jgi:ABC-type phosphate transport system auxiliary subunit